VAAIIIAQFAGRCKGAGCISHFAGSMLVNRAHRVRAAHTPRRPLSPQLRAVGKGAARSSKCLQCDKLQPAGLPAEVLRQ